MGYTTQGQLAQLLKSKGTPALYTQDGKGKRAKAYAKLRALRLDWTWYVMEFDGKDTCFGLVIGHEREYGYFTLSELCIAMPFMDTSFQPMTIEEIEKGLQQENHLLPYGMTEPDKPSYKVVFETYDKDAAEAWIEYTEYHPTLESAEAAALKINQHGTITGKARNARVQKVE